MNLKVDPFKSTNLEDARKQVLSYAAHVGSPAWIFTQSFSELRFELLPTGESIARFSEVFSGRIFGANGEVRWLQEAGSIQGWFLSEDPSGEECRFNHEKYYLWGSWNGTRFHEDVVPDLPLDRSLPKDRQLRPYQRRFIRVIEYMPNLASAECTDEGKIMDALNRPRVFAHRFAGVDAD